MSSGEAEPGKAKSAGIVSLLIACVALSNLVCGYIYLTLGGPDGSGVWSGFGQAVIAILGIFTWIKLNKTTFVFFLVMCVLWLIVTVIQVVVALTAWLIWYRIRKVLESECEQIGDACVCPADKSVPFTVHNCNDIKTIESCFVAMVIVNAIGAILILAGSIIGCMGTCCTKETTTNEVVAHQPGA